MKRSFTFLMSMCFCMIIHAQVTSLTIDCQNPGWLSSKINYIDQTTIRNLKVTGFINATDLKFIGSLMHNRKLKGHLDLSESNIVASSPSEKDNTFYGNVFGLNESNNKDSLSMLILPKSLNEISASLNIQWVDTLIYDTNIKDKGISLGKRCSNLILGENVETIEKHAYSTYLNPHLKSLHLPSKIKYIGDWAFEDAFIDFYNVNFDALSSVEYLGYESFYNNTDNSETLPDTIRLPNLKVFQAGAFRLSGKKTIHFFFGDNLKRVYKDSETSYSRRHESDFRKVVFHFTTPIPPTIISEWQNTGLTIYVPKGAKGLYKKYWNGITIIEAPSPLQSINLDRHSLKMEKNDQEQLSVNFIPQNADNTEIIWTTNNHNVSVSKEGLVTAKSEGKSVVYAQAVDGTICDSCQVEVITHVTGMKIEPSTLTFNNLGASFKLNAIIEPKTATDTTITWSCPTPSVCTIFDDGTVIATGNGTAVVIATSNDGHIPASCIVTVDTNSTGFNIMKVEKPKDIKIYSLKGELLKALQKGTNIIKCSNGYIQKVIIK